MPSELFFTGNPFYITDYKFITRVVPYRCEPIKNLNYLYIHKFQNQHSQHSQNLRSRQKTVNMHSEREIETTQFKFSTDVRIKRKQFHNWFLAEVVYYPFRSLAKDVRLAATSMGEKQRTGRIKMLLVPSFTFLLSDIFRINSEIKKPDA
jgi:hypothetical protein